MVSECVYFFRLRVLKGRGAGCAVERPKGSNGVELRNRVIYASRVLCTATVPGTWSVLENEKRQDLSTSPKSAPRNAITEKSAKPTQTRYSLMAYPLHLNRLLTFTLLAATVVPDPSPDVLSLFTPASIPGYQTSQNINGISALVAMHEATKAFRNLTSDASKTFIFTGNKLNIITLKGMLNFGLGKTTTSYTIKYIVEQGIYKEEGVK